MVKVPITYCMWKTKNFHLHGNKHGDSHKMPVFVFEATKFENENVVCCKLELAFKWLTWFAKLKYQFDCKL